MKEALELPEIKAYSNILFEFVSYRDLDEYSRVQLSQS